MGSHHTHMPTQRPKHSLPFKAIEFVVSYAEQNGLLLPGRIPGCSHSDLFLTHQGEAYGKHTIVQLKRWKVSILLPTPPSAVFRGHCCHQSSSWSQRLTSFGTCHQNSTAILRDTNCSEASSPLEHLRNVKVERNFYKSSCNACRNSVRASQWMENFDRHLCHQTPLQIPLTSSSLLLWLCTTSPFSILPPPTRTDLLPNTKEVYCVWGELWDPPMPSQLSHWWGWRVWQRCKQRRQSASLFLETHGLSDQVALLHADTCTGQNNNNCMVQYLAWQALTNRHISRTLSFLVVSKTKFAPDWCFELFKRHYRRTKVGSLRCIAQVVNNSTECNFAQLVCNKDGTTNVPTYAWTVFFAPHLKKVVGIKKCHHFQCDSSKPGVVYVKEHVDTSELGIDLMKSNPHWLPHPKELLPLIPPKQGIGIEMSELEWFWNLALWGVNVYWMQVRVFLPGME